jgi:hypothetical protein
MSIQISNSLKKNTVVCKGKERRLFVSKFNNLNKLSVPKGTTYPVEICGELIELE